MNDARLRGVAATASLFLAFAGSALAEPPSAGLSQTAGGVVFHYGVVPAELLRGHPAGHGERRMHGGPGDGEHVVLAVFDAATGERIVTARVTAIVSPLGAAPQVRTLEPMPVAGAASFGNFFSLSSPGVYRIRFEVERPDRTTAVAEFEYRVPVRGSVQPPGRASVGGAERSGRSSLR